MHRRFPVTRRTMLRGMGAALALPWLESFGRAESGGAAKSTKPPVRMAFWYVPNGVHLPTWFPEHEGVLVDLPDTLEPLAFARDHLVAFHGLTHNKAQQNGDMPGCGHGMGAASFLTGAQAYKSQDDVRVGVSIDQQHGQAGARRPGSRRSSWVANRRDRAMPSVTAGPIRRISRGGRRRFPLPTR